MRRGQTDSDGVEQNARPGNRAAASQEGQGNAKADAGEVSGDAAEKAEKYPSLANKGCIVIIGRNNIGLTKLAVASALTQDVDVSVFLVDNNSSDLTSQWGKSKFVRKFGYFACYSYREQKSLSACWNDALINFWQCGFEHLLILNNDVEIRPDTYRLLLAHGGPFVTCVSVRTHEEMRYPELPTTESPHPDFSCFLIRKEVTDKVGFFPEDYFPAHFEDNCYHARMHRAGIKAVSIDLPFLHHGASTLKSADPVERRFIEKGAAANREKFYAEFGCYPGTSEYGQLFR